MAEQNPFVRGVVVLPIVLGMRRSLSRRIERKNFRGNERAVVTVSDSQHTQRANHDWKCAHSISSGLVSKLKSLRSRDATRCDSTVSTRPRPLLSSDDGKKALAGRAKATDSAASQSLTRTEPAGGLPAELRQGLDVVVIMLHGPYGEDGTIQGLFELADVPYVGAGVLASAVGMDKVMMKAVFQAHGLPIVEHVVIGRNEWRNAPGRVATRVAETIGFPCFVKPSNLGSSVGISKVSERAALAAAIDLAARYDRKIIVERGVNAREIG